MPEGKTHLWRLVNIQLWQRCSTDFFHYFPLLSPLSLSDPPRVQIVGYDNNWYKGRTSAFLTCQADGNPPPTTVTWRTWVFHFSFSLHPWVTPKSILWRIVLNESLVLIDWFCATCCLFWAEPKLCFKGIFQLCPLHWRNFPSYERQHFPAIVRNFQQRRFLMLDCRGLCYPSSRRIQHLVCKTKSCNDGF